MEVFPRIVVWGEEGLEEVLPNFIVGLYGGGESRFFRFVVELGAHSVGAGDGGCFFGVFPLAGWLFVLWG